MADKTGTLTHACPVCCQGLSRSAVVPNDMLRVASLLEDARIPWRTPLSALRVGAIWHEEMHSQVEYIVAHGISSMVENKKGRYRQCTLYLRG